jgi:hypothetical protein
VDNGPIDPVMYMNVMKRIRRRRLYFFAIVLLYIPALWITYQIFHSNKAMGTLFCIWVFLLILVTFMVAVSRCPRCGNYFHVHGMTLLVLRKCLHCQHHISSDSATN